MASIKSFFLATVKLALALLLALMAVSIAIWAVSSYRSKQEEKTNAALATPKVWPPRTLEQLGGVKLELTTMWRDRRIYYQFVVVDYSPQISIARDERPNATFTIEFLDASGFRMFEHTVRVASMARVIDDSGARVGLSWQGTESLSSDLYRSAALWQIKWGGFPNGFEPPVEQPKWKDTANWRRLSRNMTQEEVRALLGEPARIEQGGPFSTWYYGDSYLNGTIEFSGSRVRRWSEP